MVRINDRAVQLGIFRRSFHGARCSAYGTVLDAPHWLARCASVLGNLCLLLCLVGFAILMRSTSTTPLQKQRVWIVMKRVWEIALACTLGTFWFFLSDWRFVLCRASTATCQNGSATAVTVWNVLLVLIVVVVAELLVTSLPGPIVLRSPPPPNVATDAVPHKAQHDDGGEEEEKEEEIAPTMSEMMDAQTGQKVGI